MPRNAREAAHNNASWCDAVCRAGGIPTTNGDNAWSAQKRSPGGYPDAISLDPGAAVNDLLSLVDSGPDCSVKDSFATLDLRWAGFTVLFEAQWINGDPGSPRTRPVLPWHVVSTPAELVGFAAAHGNRAAFVDSLLEAQDVRVLAAIDNDVLLAGVVLNRTGPVIGVSNLFTTASGRAELIPGAIWRDVVVVAAKLFPGAPLVGYEVAQDLPPAIEAGFRTVGPLRVWIRG